MKPIVRCSELDQLFECPGSFTLQRMVAPMERGDSLEGTYIHWAIAARLVTELAATPPEGGLLPPQVPKGYKLPLFSDWIVDYCFGFAHREIPSDFAMEVETPLAYEFDRFILSGHQDVFAVRPDAQESIGADWKSVRNAVDPAESNNHCLGYIVLQKRAYPALRKARFAIVQPRVNEEEGEQRVSSVEVEGTALDDAVAYLEKRVNEALDNLDEINSGPRQCRWCDAVLQCPATIAERESMKLKLTPQMLAKVKREPDDATLADWVLSARVIEQPIKDAKEMLHDRLDKVGSVKAGGYTITQTEQGGLYSVTAPVPLYAALVATLPPHEVAKVVDPSVGRLKDALAKVLNIPKSGQAPRTAESEFKQRFLPHMQQGKRRIFKYAS